MSAPLQKLLNFDAATLGEKIRARDISPVEVTQAYLDRIEQTDGIIHAYITVTEKVARKAAKKAEAEIAKGKWRGPLHGIPVALKDLAYTKGIRTTAGSKILADFVPEHDATVWKRLERAGAVLLGKLNMHEFAYGITSSNPHWGAVRNPYATDRIPGGSSGGSAAAVAAQSAAATIGTDTGGSIRIPAALCGCVGLKPTYGRVSRFGVFPLSATLDHVGPIVRTVRDAALVLNAIAGPDRNDPTTSRERVPDYTSNLDRGIAGMRIGIIRELREGVSGNAIRLFDAAIDTLRSLGAVVDEVSIPSITFAAVANTIINLTEALEPHRKWMPSRVNDYGEDVRGLLEAGMMITASGYLRAQRFRVQALADALAALDGRSLLTAPASAIVAPEIGAGRLTEGAAAATDLVSAI
ncbi:MAG TPA: amidase, partial [Candidatus Binataceae bacterium]|nr:amidase [Candidatus Binataceae bacterium]